MLIHINIATQKEQETNSRSSAIIIAPVGLSVANKSFETMKEVDAVG